MLFPARNTWVPITCAVLSALLVACGRAPDSIDIALPTDVDTLDPHRKDALTNIGVLSNVYEALVFTDPGMSVEPVLASRWENPDPTTWVFRLRPGVVFHDGRPLSAADVVYSLQRARTGDLEMKTYLVDIADVRALDEGSVEVRTTRPDRIFLRRVAFVPIVPSGATAATLEAAPNGTGPYMVADWKKVERLFLVRNERYHGARAALREVRFRFGVKPEEAIAGLLGGRYQLVQTDAKKLRAAAGADDRFLILQTPSIFVLMLGFDLAREKATFCSTPRNPFKDPRVRRAIDLGLDRRRLVDSLSNDATPATQLVPRLVFGHSPHIRPSLPDPQQARALLAEAGLGKGFAVVLHARPFFQEAALSIRDQLGEIGITVEPRFLSGSDYYTAATRRELSFWLGSFGCTGGDAIELLNNLIHTTDATRQWGALNVGGYANPALDRAIEQSSVLEDPGDRGNALQQVMQQVAEERVLLPLYSAQDGHAVEKHFHWRPRADGFIRATEITVTR